MDCGCWSQVFPGTPSTPLPLGGIHLGVTWVSQRMLWSSTLTPSTLLCSQMRGRCSGGLWSLSLTLSFGQVLYKYYLV